MADLNPGIESAPGGVDISSITPATAAPEQMELDAIYTAWREEYDLQGGEAVPGLKALVETAVAAADAENLLPAIRGYVALVALQVNTPAPMRAFHRAEEAITTNLPKLNPNAAPGRLLDRIIGIASRAASDSEAVAEDVQAVVKAQAEAAAEIEAQAQARAAAEAATRAQAEALAIEASRASKPSSPPKPQTTAAKSPSMANRPRTRPAIAKPKKVDQPAQEKSPILTLEESQYRVSEMVTEYARIALALGRPSLARLIGKQYPPRKVHELDASGVEAATFYLKPLLEAIRQKRDNLGS